MSENERQLPPGWAETTLGEVFDWGSGGTPTSTNPDYYGGDIPWLVIGDLTDSVVTRSATPITEAGLRNSSAKWVEPGSVLIAMYGASIGRLGIAGVRLTTNQAIAHAKPTPLSGRFLFYYLLDQRRNLVNLGKGAAQSNISQTILKAHRFPFAPLSEQNRIVEEIETHFSRLDAGVAALKRVQAGLKRYRASVLQAACEGRLVPTEAGLARAEGRDYEPADELLKRILAERRAKWEADQLAKMQSQDKHPQDDKWKSKYQEPALPDTRDLPDLPECWCWATVEQVGKVQLGRQRSPKHHTGTHMRPYLRVANVFEDRLNLSDVMEMNFTPGEFATYRLRDGDILLNEGQSLELVGRPAMFRGEIEGACFQNTLVRFTAYPCVEQRYALSVFRAYLHSGRFQRIARWTTTIAHLGAERFAGMEFPLPPLAEQQRIVAEVERRLSIVEELESAVRANLKRAERLRQAILKRAFEGKLVPQDPTDQPASALLTRIKAERESSRSKTGRTRK